MSHPSSRSGQYPDFYLKACAGLIPGITPLFKFGRNLDIDTTNPEDVHELGGDYLFPTAASTISTVSDSSSDTNSGGTGIKTLTIEGLDANWELLSETIEMDGTTPVVTSNSFLRVFRAFADTSGSAQEAIGNITLTHSEGDIAYIIAGEAQSLIACYSVAVNHTLMLSKLLIGLLRQGATARFEAHFEVKLFNSNSWRVRQDIPTIGSGSSTNERDASPIWFPVPEKSDIRVRVHSVAVNDTGAIASFDGLLINNKVFKW